MGSYLTPSTEGAGCEPDNKPPRHVWKAGTMQCVCGRMMMATVAAEKPTPADVRAAWDAFFARPAGLEHIEILAPESLRDSHITMAALERVIIADRLRVLNISPTPST